MIHFFAWLLYLFIEHLFCHAKGCELRVVGKSIVLIQHADAYLIWIQTQKYKYILTSDHTVNPEIRKWNFTAPKLSKESGGST